MSMQGEDSRSLSERPGAMVSEVASTRSITTRSSDRKAGAIGTALLRRKTLELASFSPLFLRIVCAIEFELLSVMSIALRIALSKWPQ